MCSLRGLENFSLKLHGPALHHLLSFNILTFQAPSEQPAELLSSQQLFQHQVQYHHTTGLPDTHGQVCHKYPWPATISALVSVPIAMIKHQDHNSLGRTPLPCLHVQAASYDQRESGQGPEGEPGGRSRLTQRPWRSIAYCLAPHGLIRLFPSSTQDHQPSVAPPTVTWALSNQPSRKCTTAKSGDILSVEVPSSEMILTCVMLPWN